MKIYLDCIPCHIRSAINSAIILTDDDKVINNTIRQVLLKASEFGSYKNLFELYYDIQTIVKNNIPDGDPYLEFKRKFNEICLSISDMLKNEINESNDWFEKSLRICLAGNSLDVMQGKKFSREVLLQAIKSAELQPIDKTLINDLKNEIIKANKILVIGDNAGEIVFDKIFIEQLNEKLNKKGKIIYSVRGGATLNDSTLSDAEMVSMSDVAKVITTGIDMPAAHLPLCSEEFNQCYSEADVIISKGQGNLEALLEQNKNIFFLLKIKCNVIAKILANKHKVDDILIYRNKKIR